MPFREQGDYQVSYPTDNGGEVTINFNICEFAYRQCPDSVADYANVINENNTCNHMSGNELSQVDIALIDADKPSLGLQLQYEGGNFCAENNKFSLLV